MTVRELDRFLAAVTPAKRQRDAHTMLKDLEQIDLKVLQRIVARSWRTLTRDTYPLRAREGGRS